MDSWVKILKEVGLISVITSAFYVIGNVINDYIPWDILTYFFVIIRRLAALFSMFYDIDTLWTLVGYSWIILGMYIIYEMTIKIVNHFNNK